MGDQNGLQPMDDQTYNAYQGKAPPPPNTPYGQSSAGYQRNGTDDSGSRYYNASAPTYDQGAFTGAQAAQLGAAAQGRGQVAQAGPVNAGSYQGNTGYAAQQGLLQQLQQQALGQGPAAQLAQAQFRQQTDQAMRQQLAAAAANRGNPMAAYQAAQTGSQMDQQAANQAAQLRLQQQLQAQGLMGQVAGQVAGQAYNYDALRAQLGAQLGMFNAGQYNQQLGADMGAQNQFALQQGQFGQQANMANAQGNQLYQQLMGQGNMWQQGLTADQYGQQNQYLQQKQAADAAFQRQIIMALLGGGMNAGSSAIGMAALSDRRQKRDIRPGGRDVRDLLRQLKPHSYEYKDTTLPGAAPGRHVSVMAQELERHPLGKAMVRETQNGKMVDYGRGLGTMLAALADMNSRVDAMEGRRAQKRAA